MNQHIFNLAAGSIFLAVAVLHAMRLYLDWEITIESKKIPRWLSWGGLLIAGCLAYTAFAVR